MKQKKQNDDSDTAVYEVLRRPEGSSDRLKSVATDLSNLLETTKHTNTLRSTIGILSDVAMIVLLWALLIIAQVGLRGWALLNRSLESALYPMTSLVRQGSFAGAFVLVMVLTIVASAVAALLIWVGIVVVMHRTVRPWKLVKSAIRVVPPRGADSTVTLRYLSGDARKTDTETDTGTERINRLFVEASEPALAKAVVDPCPSTEQMDASPDSVLDAAVTTDPNPIVLEFRRSKLDEMYGSPDEGRRPVDRLIETTSKLPCPAELQIVVGDGTMPYYAPIRKHSDSESSVEDLDIFDQLIGTGRKQLLDAETQPVWTVNIRIVACPRTEVEAVDVASTLESVTPAVGDERIESTLSAEPLALDNTTVPSSRIPKKIQRVSERVRTDPESTSGNRWGLIDAIRYQIGRLSLTTTSRALNESISARLIRHERHTDTRLSESAPDLLVGAEELPSLLVVGRNTTDELESALADEPKVKPPTAEQSNAYVADEAVTKPMAGQTDDASLVDAEAKSMAGQTDNAPPDDTEPMAGQTDDDTSDEASTESEVALTGDDVLFGDYSVDEGDIDWSDLEEP